MKEFFARLNPTERRFVVGVIVIFFLVINIVWVWPHFGDWGQTQERMRTAGGKLVLFETGTNLIPALQKKIADYQGQGQIVPSENQAVQFVRLIQNETTRFGIIPENMTPSRQSGPTNSFFVEQGETMTLQTTEKQLVDFLYSLGAGTNSIRVKVLSVQPDPSHQRLTTRVTLVASYQKKAIGAPMPAPRAAAPARPADKKPAPAPTPAPIPRPIGGLPPGVTPAPTPGKPAVTNRVATNHSPVGPLGAPKNLTPTKK
jgi:hypothetical protein